MNPTTQATINPILLLVIQGIPLEVVEVVKVAVVVEEEDLVVGYKLTAKQIFPVHL